MATAQLEGDAKKLAALQVEMASAATPVAPKAVEFDREAMVASAVQQVELTSMVEKITVAYPALDPTAETFDKGVNEEVLQIYQGLVATGQAPAAALARSADLVMGARGVQPNGSPTQPNARGVDSRVAAANAPAALAAGGVGQSGTVDQGGEVPLNVDEWQALPEATRRKMLGM